MAFAPQMKIPATYIRGGTSKGVFFKRDELPEACQQAGAARDAMLLRSHRQSRPLCETN